MHIVVCSQLLPYVLLLLLLLPLLYRYITFPPCAGHTHDSRINAASFFVYKRIITNRYRQLGTFYASSKKGDCTCLSPKPARQ